MNNNSLHDVSPNVDLDCVVGVSPSTLPQSSQRDSLPEESQATQGELCSQCDQPIKANANVCGHCGYYETAGIFVELETTTEEEPAPFLWYVFLLPLAMLVLIIGSFALAHFMHPKDPDRTLVSVAHLAIGLCLFLVPHFRAQIKSLKSDDNTSIFDFLIRPLSVWKPDFQQFPKSFPWMFSAALGLTAILCSLLILRGLPSPFPKTGIAKSAPPSIKLKSGNGGRAMSDDENFLAIEVEEGDGVEKDEDEGEREYLDSVIIGYNVNPADPNRVASVVLAVEEDNQYRVVATVSKGLTPKVGAMLKRNLGRVRASAPPVATELQAVWVKPVYRCRTWFTEDVGEGENNDGKPKRSEMNFDRMLFLNER